MSEGPAPCDALEAVHRRLAPGKNAGPTPADLSRTSRGRVGLSTHGRVHYFHVGADFPSPSTEAEP